MKKRVSLILLLCACVSVILFRTQIKLVVIAMIQKTKGEKTVDYRVKEFGATVRSRLAPAFAAAGVEYPPKGVTLIGLKSERMLEVWVCGEGGKWKHLKDYPILGMSGKLGPKLKEGDMQVPEGLYRVESLNPNSLYHLALRVNYPNEEDMRRGKDVGRNNLGSDIMIHGESCSIGCLAMGNEAAEDLFVMAAETGIENISIILSPVDFRAHDLPGNMPPVPSWTNELYRDIRRELGKMIEL